MGMNRMTSSTTLRCINAIEVKQIGMLVRSVRARLWAIITRYITSNVVNLQHRDHSHQDITPTSNTVLGRLQLQMTISSSVGLGLKTIKRHCSRTSLIPHFLNFLRLTDRAQVGITT